MPRSTARLTGGLEGFHTGLAKLEDGLTLLAAIAIFFLMFVAVAQILARNVLGTAINGYVDYIEQANGFFAFLGIAYCQRFGSHVRMDALLRLLPPRGIWVAEMLGTVLGLVIIGLLIDGTFNTFLTAYRLGDTTMDIRLPIWPTKLMVPAALAILWLRLLVQALGYVRLVLHPEAVPIGVPALETIREQATAEIEETLGREAIAEAGAGNGSK